MSPADILPVPSWIERGRLRWVWTGWEPERFYRRAAYGGATSPGNAEWMPQWYERIRSEEMVAKLAELGINCVSTCWFKGYGLDAEEAEMERSAQFTELCHQYGMKVLGYHQATTICWETFLDEAPHAKDWIQREADGSLMCYGSGSVYWRWMACPRCDEHKEYLDRVVRKCLEVAKMDGVEWDGTRYKCHCERCQRDFNEWVQQHYPEPEELFGLPHLRHAHIPPNENRNDPMYQAVIRFRDATWREWLRHFNVLTKSIDPQAAHVTYFMGEWPDRPLDDIDILIDENHNVPYIQDGMLTTKLRGYKVGDARERVVLVTAWLRAPSAKEAVHAPSPESTAAEVAAFGAPVGGLRRPETALEAKRDLAESACYGGHMLTATYSLRGVGGDRVVLDDPVIYDALKQYFDFFRAHEELYADGRSLANVALYRSTASFDNDFFAAFPCAVGMEQVCLQHQIPFDVLFPYQLDRLGDYAALVLPNLRCLGDGEIAAITAYVEAGRGLLFTGQTGMCDPHGRLRSRHPLVHLAGRGNVVFLPDAPEQSGRPERDHPPAYKCFRSPDRSDELAAAIGSAAGCLPVALGRREPYVGVDLRALPDGRAVLHLLNYDNTRPLADLPATVQLPGSPATAACYSPDCAEDPTALPVSPASAGCAITVPRLETYAAVVFGPAACQP